MGKKKVKETLLKDGEATKTFKDCLVQIFGRFDADNDKLLSAEELQAFSRAANKDGHEFGVQEISAMQDMFDWGNDKSPGGLTLRGFVQMYTAQTKVSEAETRSDLLRLGYDGQLQPLPQGIQSPAETEGGQDLDGQLREFLTSDAVSMSFPSLTAQDRKQLHVLSKSMRLHSQSFGYSSSTHVFKPPEAAPRATKLPQVSTEGTVLFSGVELDSESSERLVRSFQDKIPAAWEKHAHHMTICLGSLAEARSNEAAGDSVKAEVRKLWPGTAVALRVVSLGKKDGVVALGVIGCPSLNKYPHVTLACGSGHKPVESNQISDWAPLSENQLICLTGTIREFRDTGAQSRSEILAQLKKKEAEILTIRQNVMTSLEDAEEELLLAALKERNLELELLREKTDDNGWNAVKAGSQKKNGRR